MTAQSSAWAALRDRHKQIIQERDPLYIEDPVHDGVVLRYRYVPLEDSEGSVKRVQKVRGAVRQTVAGSIERILLCIDEIMVEAPDGEVPLGRGGVKLYGSPVKPLSDDEIPIKFDERLCQGMEFPDGTSQSAAKIVRVWFANNGYQIVEHAAEVTEWLAEATPEVREEFEEALGKAPGVSGSTQPPTPT